MGRLAEPHSVGRRHAFADPDQQIISITADSRPASRPDLVNNFTRLCPTLGDVATDEHFVDRLSRLDVRDHLRQSETVAMDVRDDRDPHRSASGYVLPVDEYYDRRAAEYDATAWDSPLADQGERERVREVLATLAAARTVDVGCGTGYVTRWLPGEVTLADASRAMLGQARQRFPRAAVVQANALALPFGNGSFERAFAANLYGHFARPDRVVLLRELARVATEVVILDQLANSGEFEEGPETRLLNDGSRFVIHKCYFTVAELLSEVRALGTAELMMDGPAFSIVRVTFRTPG